MQSHDFHQRYFHPHYVVALKLYIQSDGSIVLLQGNVKLEVNPEELLSLLDGIVTFASVYSVLHDRLSDDNTDRMIAESKEGT